MYNNASLNILYSTGLRDIAFVSNQSASNQTMTERRVSIQNLYFIRNTKRWSLG
jgi:hypothetical protein